MVKKALLIGIVLSLVCVLSATAEELTPQLCKDKAIAAAQLLEEEGAAALVKIRAEEGDFRFADGKGYVWVHNLDGLMLVHPIKPSLEGQGLFEIRDMNGVYLFVAMNEVAEEKGQGWVAYIWPKPGERVSSSKVSFVVLAKHGDQEYVAGSGMYDVTAEDIKAQFPDDAIYEE